VPDREDELNAALQLMRTGDEVGFRTVYRAVHPPVLRYLTVLVGADDAEDVASETWGQVFRDLPSFSGDVDGFRGWLTTIGRNRAMDHLRRASRRPVADLELGQALDVPDLVDVAGAAIDTEHALALIRSLPPDQAEAVVLRVILGFDAKTAAAIVGKSAGSVRVAAHRGLNNLAKRLDDSS
jgi:RNA polymerase sigma-70 factor (ECF subfamily)